MAEGRDEVKKDLEKMERAEPAQVNGYTSLEITAEGVFLTVLPPSKGGKLVELDDVVEELGNRGVETFDFDTVKNAVYLSSGDRVKIAEPLAEPQVDGQVSVEIAEDKMRAYLTVFPPQYNGRALELVDCMAALEKAGVVAGIDEDEVKEALLTENGKPVLVAQGTPPQDGEDAILGFKFERQHKVAPSEEKDGQVDYRDLDLIENVVISQVLLIKTPATPGSVGHTVTGGEVEPKAGEDVAMPTGKNVEGSEDGLTMTSVINGHVKWVGNRVVVEPIFEVDEVNMSTGNIVFLGDVIVKRDVLDNFTVKAGGGIIVHGSVGRSVLEATEDVEVRKGIIGKRGVSEGIDHIVTPPARTASRGRGANLSVGTGAADRATILDGYRGSSGSIRIEGLVKADENIRADFVENANIRAGNNIEVTDSIVNSHLDAGRQVIVKGSNGLIVGGRVRAGEEIMARTLGSEIGVPTQVEAGVNPQLTERIEGLEQEIEDDEAELNDMDQRVRLFLDRKKRGELDEEKERELKSMLDNKKRTQTKISNIKEELTALNSQFSLFKGGKIRVSGRVYPGVTITIRNGTMEVVDTFSFATFFNEGGFIKMIPYDR